MLYVENKCEHFTVSAGTGAATEHPTHVLHMLNHLQVEVLRHLYRIEACSLD